MLAAVLSMIVLDGTIVGSSAGALLAALRTPAAAEILGGAMPLRDEVVAALTAGLADAARAAMLAAAALITLGLIGAVKLARGVHATPPVAYAASE